MSNTATLVDSIPAQIGGVTSISEYELVIDSTGTDLDVITPGVSTNRIWVIGIWMAESTALSLTLKSENTGTNTASKTQTWELAANQGLTGLVNNSFLFCTKPGEKLTVQSTAAIGTTPGKNFVLRVAESAQFVGR